MPIELHDQLRELALVTPSRIVMVVADGLGGLPHPDTGRSELETASTPHLDALAGRSSLGLIEPVGPGITPGSGPAHLALFGYDPFQFIVGRGVMEALGIDFDLQPGDVAARGNFCTVDERGVVVDRRAGRITTERCAELCELISHAEVDGVELFVRPVREHRFAIIMRSHGLSDALSDTDLSREGVVVPPVAAREPTAQRTAQLANRFVSLARDILSEHWPANMVLLRGFSRLPHLPTMSELYRLTPAAIASYPMYRGLAKVVGMAALPVGPTLADEVSSLSQNFNKFDFLYLHFKRTDTAGEDGNFTAKVAALEELDSIIPALLELGPEALIITGDHSTPATLHGHSWHPVPFLLASPWARPSGAAAFSERSCAVGNLGTFPSTRVMALALAHARKLTKFGA